ncbi:MAG: ribosome biogenesis GTPase Der [Gemmatimonadetes bacterium]|jgi:GTP-binding protein|nr:ribosome biogenesis GTPase Der [Gemmatimonadota bacterium]MBT5141958.1 ribosome biogenesis GTPase Der [Gemmatimonadota bacterium]MBT5589752.1 ribosome biogenesis GTPase Der [Gemmatimonadota bacterium]MBT5964071.1 ribosome biogenesis GTPase Der [Gemmatimonadota bacterium]MBT6625636.1 ribosome biogenesis GTPase Der [Gemmatimonadota bacterium]
MSENFTTTAAEVIQSELPVVAIVGRPNVGKSTLFNRITGRRQAITDDQPGVTRDRVSGEAEWKGIRFSLVDTGGFITGTQDTIEQEVRSQAEQALDEADLVVMLCDAREGVTGLDSDVGNLLRRRSRPCMLVLNKVDHPESGRYQTAEFYRLGLGDPFLVSASNGRRTGDLLDEIVERLAGIERPTAPVSDERVRIVLAGRPNVGKSTLINRLADVRVSIVHDKPGTTRDSTDVALAWRGNEFLLVDTAGMRRRSKVDDSVEYFSGLRASHSIERADVVVAMTDASEGVTVQDVRIMDHVLETGRALVIAVNKWDLVDTTEMTAEHFRQNIVDRYPFLRDYPILCLSALTGRRAYRVLEAAATVAGRARERIPTSVLNRWVEKIIGRTSPAGTAREVRLTYMTQSAVSPPTFLAFSNRPDLVEDAYNRYVENRLRLEFGFEGTPLRIHWRSSRSNRARKAPESS